MTQTQRRWATWGILGLALVIAAGVVGLAVRSAPAPAPAPRGADGARTPPSDGPPPPAAAPMARRPARKGPRPLSSGLGPSSSGSTTEAPSPAGDTGSPLLDASDTGLASAIRTVVPVIADCYNAWLSTDGDFEGRLDVLFVIGQDTGVDAHPQPLVGDVWPVSRVVTLNDELQHPMMELCVKNAISGLEFVPPEVPPEEGDRIVVEQPFSFHATR